MSCVLVGDPPIDDLEQRTVDYRRQIEQGHVLFSTELQVLRSDGAWRTANTCDREIMFDGDRNRSDTRWTVLGDGLMDKSRSILCRNCDPGRQFVSWMTNERIDAMADTCVHVQPVAETEGMALYTPIDPRMAGMSPMGIANSIRYSLTSYLLDPKRLDLVIEPDVLRGRPCQRISWRKPDGVRVRFWIDPEQGPSVVKLEEAAPHPGRMTMRTEMEYRRDGVSDLWFPSKITDTLLDGDKEVQIATTTVRVQSLNQALHPQTFTMAGLDIPDGTCVRYEDQAGPFIWNGTKVIRTTEPPRRVRELARLDQADSALTWRTTLLLGNGLLLALLGCWALWRFATRPSS